MITPLSLLLLIPNFIPQKYNYSNYYVRLIELIRDNNSQLQIVFFDNSQIDSEAYCLKSVRVDREYEHIFIESGLELEVKYPIELFGLSPFPIKIT